MPQKNKAPRPRPWMLQAARDYLETELRGRRTLEIVEYIQRESKVIAGYMAKHAPPRL